MSANLASPYTIILTLEHRCMEGPGHPPPFTSSPGPWSSSQNHLPAPQLPEVSQVHSIPPHSFRLPGLQTGSYSEPLLWQILYQIDDTSCLVLSPELWDLQVHTSHQTEESPSAAPKAGSPRSPAEDRASQNPGPQQSPQAPAPRPHGPGRGDAPARSCPCRRAACDASSGPR